tara:strand:- start:4967 stop:5392 length:426 start_codon:yes stop_codon:yes gene_type:complete
MKNIFLTLSVLFLVSCGTQTDFEIKDENGKTGILVQTNGNILVDNVASGKITKDGTVTDNDGKVIAKIGENNLVTDSEGRALIKITEKGKMDNGSGVYIEWSEDGELMKGNQNTGMKISPVKEDSFRNASIILFLYLSFGK